MKNSSSSEPIKHGACVGLGLATMGSADEGVYVCVCVCVCVYIDASSTPYQYICVYLYPIIHMVYIWYIYGIYMVYVLWVVSLSVYMCTVEHMCIPFSSFGIHCTLRWSACSIHVVYNIYISRHICMVFQLHITHLLYILYSGILCIQLIAL